MEDHLEETIKKFSALSQDTRLKTFLFLVEKAPKAVAAGIIAREIGVPQNTMSTHLSVLLAAGLLTMSRSGRFVYYAVDLQGVKDLITFLIADCCHGNPDECSSLVSSILAVTDPEET